MVYGYDCLPNLMAQTVTNDVRNADILPQMSTENMAISVKFAHQNNSL
jgi:hypothetical protein